jgi:hypothetical protein
MSNKALEAFGALGDDDEELGPTDWPTVKKYITTLNDVEGDGKRLHPNTPTDTHNNLDPMNIIDIRLRFLNGVQAAYWGLLEEGRITQATAIILMQSVDEALDFVSEKPLCDWNGLQSNVNFPNYYKLLDSSPMPKKLVTYIIVERLEFACSISAAFLRAHRIAQQQLHDFIGDSEFSSLVITESKAEGEEARMFLEEVRASFPQVLRVVKTRQVTYSVLNHLIKYVQNLKKVGLLEEKEMAHLHDAVQTDLKKLLRNPPVVSNPKINDLLSANPLLGALPTSVCNQFVGSTKELVKLRGTTLYKAGSKPNGIWLISNGVVKWTTRNKNSVHPACTHGTTLGLYEVLIGKPYICDIVTDSVVLCFFIEAESILSVLRSDNQVVEDFLWKESVLILAKLLVPEIFEKMSMQDLRVLVAERSMISKHVRGETIEVPHHFISFLLEGSVKTSKGTDEIITSPAALFPASVDLNTRGSETLGVKSPSFSHQSSCYEVETRVRVIMFDIAAFEHLTRSHASLMTFPECLNAPGSAHEHPTFTHNLSAKAMQLSIYGSTNIWSGESFLSSLVKPVSVRSEGSTTSRDIPKAKFTSTPFSSRTQRSGVMDIDSSDESNAEDEHVVRIGSPSTLSFHQT